MKPIIVLKTLMGLLSVLAFLWPVVGVTDCLLNQKIATSVALAFQNRDGAFGSDHRSAVAKNNPTPPSTRQNSQDGIPGKKKDILLNRGNDIRISDSLDATVVTQIIIVLLGVATFILWRQRLLAHRNLQLQRLKSELNRLSVTDRLTGLFNRFYMDKYFGQEIERIQRYRGCFSAVLLDIDFFKKINDRLGHVAGDRVLKNVAAILTENVRSADIVCRWGGEEFLLLLPETSLSQAEQLAEKMRRIVAETDFGTGEKITASIGVCQYSNLESMDQFLLRLDYCLCQSKRDGRNRVTASSLERSQPPDSRFQGV